MELFIVGDLHGCYHTFRELLKHWKPEEQLLINVGDIIDRGNYSPELVSFCKELQTNYKAVFLRGNHEQMCINFIRQGEERWLPKYGTECMKQYLERGFDLTADVDWFASMPLFWENEHLFVSHAGITETPDPLNTEGPESIIWTRKPLKNIGKVQVIGHTPQKSGTPLLDLDANAWYIDTGVYKGRNLTAMIFSETGEVKATIQVPTFREDIM